MRPVVTGELELVIPVEAPTADDVARAVRAPNRTAALARVIAESAREQEELAKLLKLDAGQFSRIVSGKGDRRMYLPHDAYHPLQRAAGNWSLLLWDVHHAGFDPTSLRPRESELERANRQLREQLEEERAERRAVEAAMHRMIVGKASP
jgi:hypothetical protein